jgi:hypothetical protein
VPPKRNAFGSRADGTSFGSCSSAENSQFIQKPANLRTGTECIDANGVAASEKGVTRVLFSKKEGETRTFFSRFHTISRKENGVWRVLTDYAPESTADVGEEQFMRAKALDDFAEFRCYMPYPERKSRCDGAEQM